MPPEKYQDAQGNKGDYLINLLQKCHDSLMIGHSSQEEAEKNYRTKIEDTLREYAMTYGLQIPGATNETATS